MYKKERWLLKTAPLKQVPAPVASNASRTNQNLRRPKRAREWEGNNTDDDEFSVSSCMFCPHHTVNCKSTRCAECAREIATEAQSVTGCGK